MEFAGIPVYGIEAYLSGQPQQTKGRAGWMQVEVTNRSIMFLKENLINLVVSKLPPQVTKVAWVDADLQFSNPSWFVETQSALDHCLFVQPFTSCAWTGRDGGVELRRKSCVIAGLDDRWLGHPGFAWAARRSFFESVGLYDAAIVGSGDTITALGFLGAPTIRSAIVGVGPVNYQSIYMPWRIKVETYIAGHHSEKRFGAVSGGVYHSWHGDRLDRKYVARNVPIESLEVSKHIVHNANGIYEWTQDTPKAMINGVASYFKNRKEDG